jgi:hypothetical protein
MDMETGYSVSAYRDGNRDNDLGTEEGEPKLRTGGDRRMTIVKEEARQILEKLPEDATWDDLMYEIYVKQKITDGQDAADRGQVIPHPEARKRVSRR